MPTLFDDLIQTLYTDGGNNNVGITKFRDLSSSLPNNFKSIMFPKI